jgi:hypothetical protein
MGCGGSKDEVKQVTLKNTARPEEPLTEKQAAIHQIFSKPEESEEILMSEPVKRKEFMTAKLKLVKRQGPTDRNVNLLIEDNTKVTELH